MLETENFESAQEATLDFASRGRLRKHNVLSAWSHLLKFELYRCSLLFSLSEKRMENLA